jgi:hypothetical protein
MAGAQRGHLFSRREGGAMADAKVERWPARNAGTCSADAKGAHSIAGVARSCGADMTWLRQGYGAVGQPKNFLPSLLSRLAAESHEAGFAALDDELDHHRANVLAELDQPGSDFAQRGDGGLVIAVDSGSRPTR